MRTVFLVLVVFASVYSESQVRETETWMPMKMTQAVSHDELVSSGDIPNGSDFPDEEHDTFDNEEDEEDTDDEYSEDYEDFSGSGDGVTTTTIINDNTMTMTKPDMNDNKIPDLDRPPRPKSTHNEIELVQKNNDVSAWDASNPEEQQSNILMAQASEESIFSKTEVLAALIAGGAVGLLFAVFLILLLVYRTKKKDEGSYDLGKKPIYKKAPTTEIYA